MRTGAGIACVSAGWIVVAVTAVMAGEHPIGKVEKEVEFIPPGCTEQFPDVPASSEFCPWIEQLVADGVSSGCGDGSRFCPDQPVTRQQLALFLERAMRGTAAWDVDADLLDGFDSSDFVTAASQTWSAARRHFYLTVDAVDGASALGACSAGYHMASVWEIFDVTELIYDGDVGLSYPGMGSGPPLEIGWARTGRQSSGSNVGANCSNHSTTAGVGTTARLSLEAPPWVYELWDCTIAWPVWCVQD